jgi:hypothetical protein
VPVCDQLVECLIIPAHFRPATKCRVVTTFWANDYVKWATGAIPATLGRVGNTIVETEGGGGKTGGSSWRVAGGGWREKTKGPWVAAVHAKPEHATSRAVGYSRIASRAELRPRVRLPARTPSSRGKWLSVRGQNWSKTADRSHIFGFWILEFGARAESGLVQVNARGEVVAVCAGSPSPALAR